MASEVDISNLSLGRIGDTAMVTSISPPDGSAQSRLCSRFYPMARDTMLEIHNWSFNTARIALTPATVPVPVPEWQFAYSLPSNYLTVIAVFDPSASDDVVFPVAQYHNTPFDMTGVASITAQNFVIESDSNGNPILYTNQDSATALLTFRITDTQKFSPLFVDALSWLLASYLAGPILKGEVGVQMGQACLKAFAAILGKATVSDANQRRVNPTQSTIASWMSNR